MKSTAWLRGNPVRGLLFTILTALAITTIGLIGCTKDAQSKEVGTSASATPASEAAPTELPATAVAIEGETLPALPGDDKAAGDTAGAGKVAVQPTEPAGTTDPAPAEPAQKTLGDSSYTLTVDAPASMARGNSGTVRVKVLPKKGWKMNKEFPTKLKVEAPEGVTVTKPKQTVKDAERFEDAGATFAVEFKVDSSGKKSFTADFKFAVCTESTCDPKRQKLAWVVDAN